MVVVVTHSAMKERDAVENISLLEYLGYTVYISDRSPIVVENLKYYIDNHHPNWFGWKGAMSAITVHHYPQMQEWNRLRQQTPIRSLDEEEVLDKNSASCYT